MMTIKAKITARTIIIIIIIMMHQKPHEGQSVVISGSTAIIIKET